MRSLNRSPARLVLIPLLLCVPLSLAAHPANAGHRSHFSFSVGFHHPHAFPSVSLYTYPIGFWGSYWGAYPLPLPARDDLGAIRLRVRPKKTDIYVDGEYVGRAGRFDGYPGYLWLESGRYTLVFYRDGFRTFSRVVQVRTGMITELKVEMESGESVPPEAFFPSPLERTPTVPRERPEPRRLPSPQPPAEGGEGEAIMDLRAEGGRLRVVVAPTDASVYLDGRFLGTGEKLSRLRGGLMLDVGEHVLDVVHPNYAPDRVSFRIRAGEEIEVHVTLDTQSRI